MRVAVSQFATSSNVQENLATCIRMINETAVCKPSIIILPQYCNTSFCYAQPWYSDHNHAWNEALSIDGDFLQKIAEQAVKHDCYILVNVTLRQDLLRDFSKNKQDCSIKSNISVSSCLFSPLGELIHQEDKQTLEGGENDFFISSSKVPEVVSTPFGKLGLLSGCDTMTFETSRELALGGAQLLCNSISSFALDQSEIHDPTRAFDNKMFLASANKVGPLVPQGHISQEDFFGSGQSQIVSPDGKVLAKVMTNEEGFVFADIDLAGVELNKLRPDSTDLFKQRRPELYQALTSSIKTISQEREQIQKAPETANVAIFATYTSNQQAIDDVCFYIENNLSDIIQLPELFFVADKAMTNNAEQLAQIGSLSIQLIKQISSVLRPFQYVCTSLVIEGTHQAVLINEHGLFAKQQQLHFCQRYQWTALGDDLNIIELPLEQGNINVAMLTADDANIPEIVKIGALNCIHLLLVPFDIQEPSEVEYGLISRAAENRICIVAASREKSFANVVFADNANSNLHQRNKTKNKSKAQKSTGLIANLTAGSALLPQWKSDKFKGYINQPLVKHQHGKITKALVHPIAATKN